jgi:RNA polymerase sigma factor (TIGR02999 family)
MAEVDQEGDGSSSDLFRAVYDELRMLARRHMANERTDHTLQTTALVHEAYLRLNGTGGGGPWKNRAHFFSAAAESMRRILVDHARRKKALCHGGALRQVELDEHLPDIRVCKLDATDVLALDEALGQLAAQHPEKGELVKLLYYAGLSLDETAAILGTSRSSVHRQWVFARAWLQRAMSHKP